MIEGSMWHEPRHGAIRVVLLEEQYLVPPHLRHVRPEVLRPMAHHGDLAGPVRVAELGRDQVLRPDAPRVAEGQRGVEHRRRTDGPPDVHDGEPARQRPASEHLSEARRPRGLGVVHVNPARRPGEGSAPAAEGHGRPPQLAPAELRVEDVGGCAGRRPEDQLHQLGHVARLHLLLVEEVAHRGGRMPQLEAVPVEAQQPRGLPGVADDHRPGDVLAAVRGHPRGRPAHVAEGDIRTAAEVQERGDDRCRTRPLSLAELRDARVHGSSSYGTAGPGSNAVSGRFACGAGMPPRLLNLPPLELFRGFVAVGRSLNVTAAARELAITQPALSRQIHALEDALGCALFVRQHRSVELTPEGTRLFRTADAWLDQLGEAIEALRPVDPSSVAITTSSGFAALWLLPRLGRFQAEHPEVDLRVVASNRILDLEREAIDLAVRYCPPEDAPSGAVRLFGEELLPVSSVPVDLDDPAERGEAVFLDFDDPSHPL